MDRYLAHNEPVKPVAPHKIRSYEGGCFFVVAKGGIEVVVDILVEKNFSLIVFLVDLNSEIDEKEEIVFNWDTPSDVIPDGGDDDDGDGDNQGSDLVVVETPSRLDIE